MTKIDFRLRQQCNKRTACSTVQTEFCRYTELIRLCFQHKWIASLGAVSTVLCTPLQMNQHSIRSFTSVQMVHTHTLPPSFFTNLSCFAFFMSLPNSSAFLSLSNLLLSFHRFPPVCCLDCTKAILYISISLLSFCGRRCEAPHHIAGRFEIAMDSPEQRRPNT